MILCSRRVCPLVEDNTTVGLNFMWLTTQHALTQAAGAVALGLNALKPLCSSVHKMSQRTSVGPGHSHGKVILLCLFLSAESGLPL